MSSPAVSASKKSALPLLVLFGVLIAVLGGTLYPIFYGQSRAEGRLFTAAGTDTVDHALYMSIMDQGARGAWETVNLATTDKQSPHILHLYYVTFGHVAKLVGASMPVMYQIARVVTGAGFIIWVWVWLNKRFSQPTASVALLFVFLTSGLGWLGFSSDSVDLWFSESNTFAIMNFWPHLIWVLLLKTVATVCLFEARERPAARYGVVAGIACVFLAFDHPMGFSGMAITFVLYAIVRIAVDRKLGYPLNLGAWAKFFAIAGVIAVPVAAYVYFQAKGEPLQMARMNLSSAGLGEPDPAPIALLLGYGLLIPLGLIPAFQILKGTFADQDRLLGPVADKRVTLFLYVWGYSNLLVMYLFSDTWYGRRLLLGAHLPLAILAAIGLVCLLRAAWPTLSSGKSLAVAVLATVILSLSQVAVIEDQTAAYDRGSAMNVRYYLTQDEVTELRDLGDKTPMDLMIQPVPQPIVVPETGKVVPDITLVVYGMWLTHHYQYVGHLWETPHFRERLQQVVVAAGPDRKVVVAPFPK